MYICKTSILIVTLYVLYLHVVIESFQSEWEFSAATVPNMSRRSPQHAMTKDPKTVWPNAVVPYIIDHSLGT